MRWLGAVVGLFFFAAGCTPGEPAPPIDGQGGTTALTPELTPYAIRCNEQMIVPELTLLDEPSPSRTVVLEVVALPTSDTEPAPLRTQPVASGGFWSKSGLLVRTGASVELSVPHEWRDRLSIRWGGPGEETWDLTVPSCDSQGAPSWVAYAGGFGVSETACVPLLVRNGGQERRVTIGIGAPCPGQDLPGETGPAYQQRVHDLAMEHCRADAERLGLEGMADHYLSDSNPTDIANAFVKYHGYLAHGAGVDGCLRGIEEGQGASSQGAATP